MADTNTPTLIETLSHIDNPYLVAKTYLERLNFDPFSLIWAWRSGAFAMTMKGAGFDPKNMETYVASVMDKNLDRACAHYHEDRAKGLARLYENEPEEIRKFLSLYLSPIHFSEVRERLGKKSLAIDILVSGQPRFITVMRRVFAQIERERMHERVWALHIARHPMREIISETKQNSDVVHFILSGEASNKAAELYAKHG